MNISAPVQSNQLYKPTLLDDLKSSVNLMAERLGDKSDWQVAIEELPRSSFWSCPLFRRKAIHIRHVGCHKVQIWSKGDKVWEIPQKALEKKIAYEMARIQVVEKSRWIAALGMMGLYPVMVSMLTNSGQFKYPEVFFSKRVWAGLGILGLQLFYARDVHLKTKKIAETILNEEGGSPTKGDNAPSERSLSWCYPWFLR